MSFLSKIFGNSKEGKMPLNPLQVDMHSHLFPGIDDGVDTFDESLEIIRAMVGYGYRKLIITPHIMSDFYRNTPEIIRGKCRELQDILRDEKIDIKVEPAAEYYLDENFTTLLKKGDMLSFGKNYLLVETNYTNPIHNLAQVLFDIKIAGFKPVLAHPERYTYMHSDWDQYQRLFDMEILFQVNLFSLVGYYSPQAGMVAEKLLKNKMVHFIGTDVHHSRHLKPMRDALGSKPFRLAAGLNLLNNSLL